MATIIHKRTDETIRLGLAPLLKERGFTKEGRRFRRAVGEAIQVVEVQSWKYNEGDSGKFTINLGVYFREVAEIAEGWVGESPAANDCTARFRLGHVMPKSRDKWWKLRPKRWWDLRYRFDPQTVARQIDDAMRNFGLPWLEKTTTRDGLRIAFDHWAFVDNPIHPYTPYALEILEGRKDEAARLLHRNMDNPAFGPHVEKLREWGKKQGLI